MKTIKKITIGLLIISPLLMNKCKDDNNSDCGFVPCSYVYKSVVIQVQNKLDSSEYIFSNFKVIRIADGKDITVKFPTTQGYYPVTDDSKRELLKNTNTEVEFWGYKNGVVVFKETFVITSDCCHVSLVDGKTLFYI
jgi:hypothetical protein